MDPHEKARIVEACSRAIQGKIAELHTEIERLLEGLEQESKSTAGDKHETGRAHLQTSREHLGQQLFALEQQILHFERLPFAQKSVRIVPGSIVSTSAGVFLLSVALGTVRFEDKDIFLISPASPLGSALSGKIAGENVLVNGRSIRILDIA